MGVGEEIFGDALAGGEGDEGVGLGMGFRLPGVGEGI